LKNPLHYQFSDYDCGPTSMQNASSFLNASKQDVWRFGRWYLKWVASTKIRGEKVHPRKFHFGRDFVGVAFSSWLARKASGIPIFRMWISF